MNKTKIPVYNCALDESDDTGIFAISFVDFPANEQNFIKLNKQIKLSLNKFKQVLTGVVLIPDQMIYRNDADIGEYYIKFSAQEIEKIAAKMMSKGIALKNTTHQHESILKGNYLTELWIVEDPKKDKSNALGLGEFPRGTLMASYKVQDAKYWRDEVLTGNVKGFSLEGIFNFNKTLMKKNFKPLAGGKPNKGGTLYKMGTFFRGVAAFLEENETEADTEELVDEAAKDEVEAGDPFLIFELQDGGEVWVDADGFATLDGEQMPAGEHALSDGNYIVIDEAGLLVVTQEEAEGVESETAATELKRAKARGRAFLKSNSSRIAKLERQLAALKRQPSTGGKVRQKTNKGGVNLSQTGKIAQVLSQRLKNK